MVLPFFKSHYSIGRSILTLESETLEAGPDSIIKIAEENSLEKVILVDDGMGGFLQAFKNLEEIGTQLIYGLRLTICPDIDTKDEDSRLNSSKTIILANNYDGYKLLIKIYTMAAKQGFYYEPRIDCKSLESFWDNEHLSMVIPFYDSFLFKNLMTYASCVPDFSFANPTLAIENNSLPFDGIVKTQVEDYAKDKFDTMNIQSIYYKSKEDFKAYLTFRCINNRSSLDKPNLDHMCSNEFCFENWKGQD